MSSKPPSSQDDSNNSAGEKTTVLHGDPETLRQELQKAKESEACLIIIRGTPQGHRYFLTQNEMTIGRDPVADISVADQSVSRKHAQISKTGGQVKLTDLGSANGTSVNGNKLAAGDAVILAKEDMVKLGNSIFKFLPAGVLETLYYGNLGDAANMDRLTGVYNKGFLLEALDAEFKRARALHTDFSVIFFDLDHFKKINDTAGHEAGDFVLQEITTLIRSSHLRPKDVFARYGGEEFVILLGNTNAQAAQAAAEKIRASIETHAFIYEGKRLPVTVSMGVTEISTSVGSAQTLLRQADKALYAAKNGGRNRVVVEG